MMCSDTFVISLVAFFFSVVLDFLAILRETERYHAFIYKTKMAVLCGNTRLRT